VNNTRRILKERHVRLPKKTILPRDYQRATVYGVKVFVGFICLIMIGIAVAVFYKKITKNVIKQIFNFSDDSLNLLRVFSIAFITYSVCRLSWFLYFALNNIRKDAPVFKNAMQEKTVPRTIFAKLPKDVDSGLVEQKLKEKEEVLPEDGSHLKTA